MIDESVVNRPYLILSCCARCRRRSSKLMTGILRSKIWLVNAQYLANRRISTGFLLSLAAEGFVIIPASTASLASGDGTPR